MIGQLQFIRLLLFRVLFHKEYVYGSINQNLVRIFVIQSIYELRNRMYRFLRDFSICGEVLIHISVNSAVSHVGDGILDCSIHSRWILLKSSVTLIRFFVEPFVLLRKNTNMHRCMLFGYSTFWLDTSQPKSVV